MCCFFFLKDQAPTQTCAGTAINANTCNVIAPTSSTSMLFTTCQNQLATVSKLSTNSALFNADIIIQGKILIYKEFITLKNQYSENF